MGKTYPNSHLELLLAMIKKSLGIKRDIRNMLFKVKGAQDKYPLRMIPTLIISLVGFPLMYKEKRKKDESDKLIGGTRASPY